MKQPLQHSQRSGTTLEKPPHYDLEIEQPENGYRYNQDPFLLTQFINRHRDQWGGHLSGECLDLGTGVGILPLLLSRNFPTTHFTGIEIQNDLAVLAAGNVKRNELSSRIKIITADYRDLSRKTDFIDHFKVVICNPPYYQVDGGRLNHCPQKRLARHELVSDLESLSRSAAAFLTNTGLFILIFPAERLVELITHLRNQKLEPKYLQFIHPRSSDRAGMLLLTARKNGSPGIIIETPLII